MSVGEYLEGKRVTMLSGAKASEIETTTTRQLTRKGEERAKAEEECGATGI